MTIAPRNGSLLERLQLFTVARPETRAQLDARPFGIEVTNLFDPLRGESVSFLELLERLDKATFGPEGMPMPRWVFVDCAEMTGAIVGFGEPADRISQAARELLAVPDDYDGLVPYAMYIAIPTFEPGIWFGHNLASLAAQLPGENLKGLGSLTKAIALATYRAHTQIGATQWHSRALYVHCRLGLLDLITASTPAHGDADTLTYRAVITDNALRNLARDPAGRISYPEPQFWVESHDLDQLGDLQSRIEAGQRFAIAGRPQPTEHGQRLPIIELG